MLTLPTKKVSTLVSTVAMSTEQSNAMVADRTPTAGNRSTLSQESQESQAALGGFEKRSADAPGAVVAKNISPLQTKLDPV